MSPNETKESIATGGGPLGDDHVEVLVEDLFIEDYPRPEAGGCAPSERGGRVARVMRSRVTSLLSGVVALAGLALAALVLAGRRRRASMIPRLYRKFQLAR